MSAPLRQHRVVLVEPARSRMRVAELEQRYVDHAGLVAATGLDAAWSCAPERWVTPDRAVHLLVPVRGARLPEQGWLPFEQLTAEAVHDDAETVAWVQTTYAGWSDATLDVPGQPWWSSQWPDSVLEWVDSVLTGGSGGRHRTGEPVPVKMWSLSAVLRIPVEDAGEPGEVWFKATCDWFRSEPVLTMEVARWAPDLCPRVIAVDEERGWMLLEPLSGAGDGSAALVLLAAAGLADLQLAVPVSRLGAVGVPTRSLPSLVEDYHEALHRSVVRDRFPSQQWASWAEAEGWVVDRIQALDALGLPLALNHGDLHQGNVAGQEATGPVVFDWTDACLTHPYLDAAQLAADVGEPWDEEVWRVWSRPWRAAYPTVDHEAARRWATTVNLAFQVVTFERIFRAQDVASRGTLLPAVPWMHEQLREAALSD